MWLLAYVPAVFGVLRCRRWSYWRWVAVIFITICAGEFLFSGHGTPDHHEFDGLVMQAVRQTMGDGLPLLLLALVFLPVFWGSVIYSGRQLLWEVRRPIDEIPLAKPARGLRKAGELIALTLVFAALTSVSVRSILMRDEAAAADAALDANLDLTVATTNSTAPKKLDEVTILTRASREGRTLVIDHEITDRTITRAAVEAFLRDRKPAEICADDNKRRLLDDGGALRFRYVLAAEAGPPVSFDISAKDCVRFASQ